MVMIIMIVIMGVDYSFYHTNHPKVGNWLWVNSLKDRDFPLHNYAFLFKLVHFNKLIHYFMESILGTLHSVV